MVQAQRRMVNSLECHKIKATALHTHCTALSHSNKSVDSVEYVVTRKGSSVASVSKPSVNLVLGLHFFFFLNDRAFEILIFFSTFSHFARISHPVESIESTMSKEK